MNKYQKQSKANHIAALRQLGLVGDFSQLKQAEKTAGNNALLYCNGNITEEQYERRRNLTLAYVKSLFGGTLPKGFFINGDPRGYALKINSGNEAGMVHHPEYIPQGLHTDWGGYGILAPEF